MLALRRTLYTLLPLSALLALGACDSGTEPTDPPARIEVVSGNAQTAVVATALTTVPTVRVLNSGGKPASNVSVTFQAADGSGTIANTTQRTDSKGIATPGTWTLGTRAGEQRLTATVEGIPAAVITVTATPGPVRTLTQVTTGTLTGIVGRALAVVPQVKVADEFGNPIAGHTVAFTVTAGQGMVANALAQTSIEGIASAGEWILGSIAGVNTLTAATSGSASTIPPVVFSATASAGAPARLMLATQPPQLATNRKPFTAPPLVQVADLYGNKVSVAGVSVTVSTPAPLTITNGTAVTDSEGVATFNGLTLSGRAAGYQLSFDATGLLSVNSAALVNLIAGEPARLVLSGGPPPAVTSGVIFPTQPIIDVVDADSNAVSASVTVTATLQGPGTLNGTTTRATSGGRATFTNLFYTGTGPFRIAFSVSGVPTITTSELTVSSSGSTASACTGTRALALNLALGETTRFTTNSETAPLCLLYDNARNRDQQYLVMFENVPANGNYDVGLFPGTNPTTLLMTLNVNTGAAPSISAPQLVGVQEQLPKGMSHAWDIGGERVFEFEPEEPLGGVPQPYLIRGGDRIGVNSANAQPAPGDTLVVFLAGIPRLGIPTGNQRAVIRLVSDELIIAEDVRLSTLSRGTNPVTYNSPIAEPDLREIARLYSLHAKQQADLLFGGLNTYAERDNNRWVAVHTLMPEAGTWGYTYMSSNVFAWDYWVQSSNGSTKGLIQHPAKVAHSLFMHEIAHMRHYGVLERAGRTAERGNKWLVEGFARFTERLASTSYLLNSADPSRTGNVVLPRYAEFNGSYYRDDVPTFLSTSNNMFGGYDASSYVFDYFADQVAARGGDWRAALNRLLGAGGLQADANAAVGAHLPGLTLAELFTRARVALYADDYGTDLPGATQYLQFQLRASRPGGSGAALDPRALWPKIVPGTPFTDARNMLLGTAWGYLIDGTSATASAALQVQTTPTTHGVMSITRVR